MHCRADSGAGVEMCPAALDGVHAGEDADGDAESVRRDGGGNESGTVVGDFDPDAGGGDCGGDRSEGVRAGVEARVAQGLGQCRSQCAHYVGRQECRRRGIDIGVGVDDVEPGLIISGGGCGSQVDKSIVARKRLLRFMSGAEIVELSQRGFGEGRGRDGAADRARRPEGWRERCRG